MKLKSLLYLSGCTAFSCDRHLRPWPSLNSGETEYPDHCAILLTWACQSLDFGCYQHISKDPLFLFSISLEILRRVSYFSPGYIWGDRSNLHDPSDFPFWKWWHTVVLPRPLRRHCSTQQAVSLGVSHIWVSISPACNTERLTSNLRREISISLTVQAEHIKHGSLSASLLLQLKEWYSFLGTKWGHPFDYRLGSVYWKNV